MNKMKVAPKLFALGVISAAVLAACGGGGGGGMAAVAGSSPSIGGTASKGIISGATVTAYCGGKNATPQVILGTATTAADGSYNITYASTCNSPVEVVLTPTPGNNPGTMYDEATGTNVNLPAGFSLSAYIANPGSTITTPITPFTDMAAQVLDNSKTAPNPNSVSAAINAVIKTALGGDAQLYNLKPLNPKDAVNGSAEDKKLSTLLTAIATRAQKLGNVNLALDELRTSATSSISITQNGDAQLNNGASSPAAVMNQDIADAQNYEQNNQLGDSNAKTLVQNEGSSVTQTTTTITPGVVGPTTAGITAANALFASLRTNLVLLSNSGKTGFFDTQVSAVRTDFKGIGKTQRDFSQFLSMEHTARNLLNNAANLPYTMIYTPTGPATGFQSFGKGGTCTILQQNQSSVSCMWGFEYTSPSATGTVTATSHQTTITPGATAGAFNWSDTVQTTIFNLNSMPQTPPAPTSGNSETGTMTNVPGSITYQGNLGGLDPAADHSSINISANETLNADSAGHTKLALTGTISNQDASNNNLLSLAVNAGSNILAIPATLAAKAQPFSATLVGTATTPNYQFNGSMAMSNFTQDLSGQYVIPSNATFTGSISGMGTQASVGQFMSGTLTETANISNYDSTKPVSTTNYKSLNFNFSGNIVVNTVSPAVKYTLGFTLDESVFGQRGVTFTYTDPSNNTVTVTRSGATPNTLTATFGGTNGITVDLTQNGGSYSGSVYSGDPTNTANLIGNISGKTVNFNDGSFITLM
ncbi:MAG: hypothetical protein G3I08_04580 [Ferrovum sp.]|nr:hypothetical protein [Ferrovum sp.]